MFNLAINGPASSAATLSRVVVRPLCSLHFHTRETLVYSPFLTGLVYPSYEILQGFYTQGERGDFILRLYNSLGIIILFVHLFGPICIIDKTLQFLSRCLKIRKVRFQIGADIPFIYLSTLFYLIYDFLHVLNSPICCLTCVNVIFRVDFSLLIGRVDRFLSILCSDRGFRGRCILCC